MDFSLFFFSSGEAVPGDRYGLVIEASKAADAAGLSSIWVPERHFSAFGCIFPNPALILTAIARETTQIKLRAGSVALPLHHPVRVAEEWSALDNLSGGRAGMACATGWHPNDFVLAPGNYHDRRAVADQHIDILRRLWRQERVNFSGVDGQSVEARIYPSPVQDEIPLWLAVSSRPEAFVDAGRRGLNLLTHLLMHDHDSLAEKIGLYRAARAESGLDPAGGRVTVWVYSHLAMDAQAARDQGRSMLCAYFKSDARQIFNGLFFHHKNKATDLGKLPDEEVDSYMEFIADRLISRDLAIFGSPESCVQAVAKLKEIGVDEVALQPDLGFSPAEVLETVRLIDRLRTCAAPALEEIGERPIDLDTHAPLPAPARAPEAAEAGPAGQDGLAAALARCDGSLDHQSFYDRFAALGLDYGGAFRSIREIHTGRSEAVAEIDLTLTHGAVEESVDHPAHLDLLVQTTFAALPEDLRGGGLAVLAGIDRVRQLASFPASSFAHCRFIGLGAGAGRTARFDIRLYDHDGELVAEVDGVETMLLERAAPKAAAEGLIYRSVWSGEPAAATSREGLSSVFLAGGDEGLLDRFSEKLIASSLRVAGRRCGAEPGMGADLAEAVLAGGASDLLYITSPQPGDGDVDAPVMAERVKAALAPLVEAAVLIARSAAAAPRLWVVLPPAAGFVEPELAPLLGFARTLMSERPEFRCTIIHAGPGDDDWIAELQSNEAGGEVAWPDGERRVRSLERVDAAAPAEEIEFDPAGLYLVTGATGGVGSSVLEWMAARGARQFLLPSRRPASELGDGFAELTNGGASVTVCQADLSNDEEVREVVRLAGGRLKGIFHLSGLLDDALLEDQSWDRFERVIRPKSEAAWALHRATLGLDLDFFVCFSSAASMFGSPGQANYAAANAFLDNLAAYRRARGLPCTTINWGPWALAGMAADLSDAGQSRLRAQGVTPLPADAALALLSQAMLSDAVTGESGSCGIFDVDWTMFIQRLGDRPALRLDEVTGGSSHPNRPRLELGDLVGAERAGAVAAAVESCIRRVLGVEEEMDRLVPLTAYGLDSLMAVELKNALRTDTGANIPVMRLLDGNTVDSLAALLLEKIDGGADAARAPMESVDG